VLLFNDDFQVLPVSWVNTCEVVVLTPEELNDGQMYMYCDIAYQSTDKLDSKGPVTFGIFPRLTSLPSASTVQPGSYAVIRFVDYAYDVTAQQFYAHFVFLFLPCVWWWSNAEGCYKPVFGDISRVAYCVWMGAAIDSYDSITWQYDEEGRPDDATTYGYNQGYLSLSPYLQSYITHIWGEAWRPGVDRWHVQEPTAYSELADVFRNLTVRVNNYTLRTGEEVFGPRTMSMAHLAQLYNFFFVCSRLNVLYYHGAYQTCVVHREDEHDYIDFCVSGVMGSGIL
jgi:hypothetical protein